MIKKIFSRLFLILIFTYSKELLRDELKIFSPTVFLCRLLKFCMEFKMKRVIKTVILSLLILSGCEDPTAIDNIPVPLLNLKEQLKKKVIIGQTDYKVISFRNSDSLFIDSTNVIKIIIGYFQNQNFIPTDSIDPTYQLQNNSKYLLSFNDSLIVTDTTLYLTAGVKYLLTGNDSLMVNKNFFLLSYPYESTHFVERYSNFILPYLIQIQDFVYRYPLIYYHPTGPDGIFEYNFETKETNLLFDYPGGDYIDANSSDVFIDYGHNFVWKYNLVSDTIEVEIDLSAVFNTGTSFYINGIAANDSLVYVITSQPNKLVILNNDLQILDIEDFSLGYCISLTFSDGYLYSTEYGGQDRWKLIKFDPNSVQLINEKISPSKATSAIKIYNGLVYFVDDDDKLLAYTPLNDIFK